MVLRVRKAFNILNRERCVFVVSATVCEPRGPPRGCLLGAHVEVFAKHTGHISAYIEQANARSKDNSENGTIKWRIRVEE